MRARRLTLRGGHPWLDGRPRGVWVALAVGALGLLASVTVLVVVIGLIGGGEGVTAGTLEVPLGRIVLVVVLGYLVALVLMVLAVTAQSAVRAWSAVVTALVLAAIVSVYPLVATATEAVGQAQQVVPWILDLVRRVLG